MRPLLIALVLLAATLAAALPAEGATVRVQRFSGFRDVTVAGTQTRYRLRLAYTVPGTWRQRGAASGLARTFGPVGSWRFTVRVTARGGGPGGGEPAATRVARLLPVSGGLLLDTGTRSNAAWRVARTSGSSTVT